eukprot:342715-Chlamydomonas_euryale.AAC.1
MRRSGGWHRARTQRRYCDLEPGHRRGHGRGQRRARDHRRCQPSGQECARHWRGSAARQEAIAHVPVRLPA